MIAIIDSGGANIASVKFALERLGADSVLTDDVAIIRLADKVLLPGVGAAPIAMQRLSQSGLIDCIRTLEQPVLGICLGMQLLFSHSAEGNTRWAFLMLPVLPSTRVAEIRAPYGLEPSKLPAGASFAYWCG